MLRFRPLPWEYGVRNLLRRPGRMRHHTRWPDDRRAADPGRHRVCPWVGGHARRQRRSTRGDHPFAGHGRERGVLLRAGGDGGSRSSQRRWHRRAPRPRHVYRASCTWERRLRHATAVSRRWGWVRGVSPECAFWFAPASDRGRQWPQGNEVLVGRLAAAKLGWRDDELRPGSTLQFEGHTWRVSGRFTAGGSAPSSRNYGAHCLRMQQALKRQDLTIVARQDPDARRFLGRKPVLQGKCAARWRSRRSPRWRTTLPPRPLFARPLGWLM